MFFTNGLQTAQIRISSHSRVCTVTSRGNGNLSINQGSRELGWRAAVHKQWCYLFEAWSVRWAKDSYLLSQRYLGHWSLSNNWHLHGGALQGLMNTLSISRGERDHTVTGAPPSLGAASGVTIASGHPAKWLMMLMHPWKPSSCTLVSSPTKPLVTMCFCVSVA